ncbi:nucleoside hydrolase [Bacillus carboniphilus]|uniref:Nucleoside hydrolase n=1 Tax=Bacillus carboniphilus TaxID=86663 RepID=A0ABN0WWB7_9BACI
MGKKVLFFGDFGIDDVFAAIYAYFTEEIDIVGIVADYGNVPKNVALKNALYLQQLTGTMDIPLIGGAANPLTGVEPTFYPEVHGPQGLGPIVPGIELQQEFENFYEINTIIEKYRDEITIVNVGRLSALATVFILYPNLISSVKDIYVMGGAFLSPGNVTPVAEANIYSDPIAANIVINRSPIPLHIVPLDVTDYALLTPEMANQIQRVYENKKHELRKVFKPLFDFYYNFYSSNRIGIKGSPMHDAVVMWALREDSEINFMEIPTQVVISEGISFGQTIGDFREQKVKATYPVHRIAMSFNYDQFISDFYQTLTNV